MTSKRKSITSRPSAVVDVGGSQIRGRVVRVDDFSLPFASAHRKEGGFFPGVEAVGDGRVARPFRRLMAPREAGAGTGAPIAIAWQLAATLGPLAYGIGDVCLRPPPWSATLQASRSPACQGDIPSRFATRSRPSIEASQRRPTPSVDPGAPPVRARSALQRYTDRTAACVGMASSGRRSGPAASAESKPNEEACGRQTPVARPAVRSAVFGLFACSCSGRRIWSLKSMTPHLRSCLSYVPPAVPALRSSGLLLLLREAQQV